MRHLKVETIYDHLVVDGHRIEFDWVGAGPDEAPTLVFLHEGLGCVAMWRDFPKELADATGCGAFVYSRLGYGGSDPCGLPRPLRFMHDEGLLTLPRILEAAGVVECVLVGHSDGGSIAIVYAGGTRAPPLRGVITEAAHVFCEPITVRSIEHAKRLYEAGDLRPKLENYHGPNTDCAFRGWNDAWLDPDFACWNLEEFLPRIEAPMLVIQGEDDEYGTRAQVDAIVGQAGGGAQVCVLPGCGHAPHRDQPEAALEVMAGFVSGILKR